VADRAAALGFRQAILTWEGPKPRTGIQAAARAARYRLMCAYMCAHDARTLLTAHTLDDQAETLLMRLARGSGLDGLAAMAPWSKVGSCRGNGALRIVRPLLGVAKARLRATLEARGIACIEDPSNQAPAFERTRWRGARADLEALGLSSDMLASSARRLQRARAALEAVTDAYCAEERGLLRTDRRYGVFRVDREELCRAPEEIALRVIGRCIAAAGGSGEPVPLGGLEPVVARLRGGNSGPAGSLGGRWTLARAQITAAGQVVQVEREPGRLPLPVMALAGGARALWDGRFAVEIAADFEGSLEVRGLGSAGLAELKRLGHAVKATPALLLAPSFWRDTQLLAVPAIDFRAREGLEGTIAAVFEGVRYNSGPGARPCSDDLDPR
jgi:tRNA(Ile)-lysidine synthase